ncbi:MAG: hypothetical protein V2J55_17335 [Candidatus Competibacteraceae bacterium]|jgi:hypothetical protein|nr:hypothetical protein [Candidatus Competibacteraceae bacterium]
MPNIPSTINGVTVEFASTVNKDVVTSMINGLKHCIKTGIASGHTLSKIYISSAKDSHTAPSRHVSGKAVDISRINSKKMSTHYSSDNTVKAIVDAIQDTFETYSGRRENFGPHLKKKNGNNWTVGGHGDHIHISVN